MPRIYHNDKFGRVYEFTHTYSKFKGGAHVENFWFIGKIFRFVGKVLALPPPPPPPNKKNQQHVTHGATGC